MNLKTYWAYQLIFLPIEKTDLKSYTGLNLISNPYHVTLALTSTC